MIHFGESFISKDKFDALANPVRKTRVESLQVTEMLIKAQRLSENLPNNNKIDLINDILSKDFPAGDLTIQFKAFTALPIPRMMTDFSRLHSAQPNADGRDILKHYAKSRMSDQDIEKLKLSPVLGEKTNSWYSGMFPGHKRYLVLTQEDSKFSNAHEIDTDYSIVRSKSVEFVNLLERGLSCCNANRSNKFVSEQIEILDK